MKVFIKNSLWLLFLITTTQKIHSQSLRINEVVASNHTGVQDEDGNYPDWIELINTGNTSINLADYFLSDDLNDKTQWQLPSFLLAPDSLMLIFASGKGRRVDQTYWHTIINEGASWKYILPAEAIPGWRAITFDDSSWQEGNSGFGYGDDDDQTIIAPTLSIFLRKEFEILDTAEIEEICFNIDYDDAFVAFINGIEIARSGIGTTGDLPAYNSPADIPGEAFIYRGIKLSPTIIKSPANILVNGNNILAVQVHNSDVSSSDLTTIPFLSVLKNGQPDSAAPATIELPVYHLHTNFKLNADGDSLFLFKNDGQIADQLIINKIPADYSFGYKPGDYSQLFHFSTPTPEKPNSSESIIFDTGLIPVFSAEGGIYPSAIDLSISATDPSAKVYYTLDGSEPDMQSILYSQAIRIDKATSIKARAYKTSEHFGGTTTKSYYPSNDSEIPVFFLTTEPENLWSEETGIYTFGDTYETVFPYHGANFWEDWEKPLHMDLFFPSGQKGFSIDGGFKIHGGGSRGYEQKSFNLYARKIYGDGSIKADIFEDKNIHEFESLVLRNSGNDWFGQRRPIGSMFRDLLMSKMGEQMNLDVATGRPCLTYLNGDFWGIYNIRERLDEQFIVDNHHFKESEFDLLEYRYSIINGTATSYQEMLGFLEANDMSQKDNYDYIQSFVDIPNFIRYQSAEIFFGNWDWPGNNIKFWKSYGANGKWRWVLYDSDFGYALYDTDDYFYHNTLASATATNGEAWPNPPWSTLILRKLLENDNFRVLFINTFADHLNTTLLPEKTNSMIDQYSSQIQEYIPRHIDKWGSEYANWLSTIDQMHEFSNLRPDILRSYFRDFFSISRNQKVTVAVSGCNNAEVLVNTVIIDQFPWQGIYFNQIPIELTAIAPTGYQFVRWEGDYLSNQVKLQIPMDVDAQITAVFEPKQPGTFEGVIINEISYNGLPESDSEDWIELYNNSNNYVNISNWILTDSKEGNYFRFPYNQIMAPQSYLVVARNLIDFPKVYPSVTNVIGQLGFGLNNAGECIKLFNEIGELQDQVCFTNYDPWPTEADGKGFTLSLKSPNTDNTLAYNWNSSTYWFGTPGKSNTIPVSVNELNKEAETKLLNCYPNPFSETLSVPVSMNEKEFIRINLFDLNGKLIDVIFEGELLAGYHTLTWNSSQLKVGIYLVRLQTNKDVQTKKVIKTNH